MRILIIGQHSDNFGDDAAGVALINRLLTFKCVESIDVLYRYENTCLPIQHDKVNHINKNVPSFDFGGRKALLLMPVSFVRIAWLKHYDNRSLKEILENHDLIFMSPCGANIGSYNDRTLLFILLYCVSLRKKVITHLNTFDKFQGKLGWMSNLIAIHCLKRMQVYTREMRSVEYLKRCGVLAHFGVDSAFMFNNMLDAETKKATDKYAVIILSKVNAWSRKYKNRAWSAKDYLENIVEPVVELCREKGWSMVLVSHTPQDVEFIEGLLSLVKIKFPSIACDARTHLRNVYVYDSIIRGSCFVVSNRYHGLVLAAKHSIPYIGLAYDTKSIEVSEYTGCKDFCFWMEEIMDGIRNMRSIIADVDRNYGIIRSRLQAFGKSELIKSVYKPTEFLRNL